MENERGGDILAYTVSYGDRDFLRTLVPSMRAKFGCWVDWFVFLGAPSPRLRESAEELLNDPRGLGIQTLCTSPENRGQHYATETALTLAREKGYKWFVRIDDDIEPKTLRFLRKMIDRLEELKTLAQDSVHRLVAAPRMVGLRNPLIPEGTLNKGQQFPVEIMGVLGGGLRVHSVEFLGEYKPELYAPLGRGDPDSIARYCDRSGGLLIRFPDIRVVHRTDVIESHDSPEQALERRMGMYWPFLGSEDNDKASLS